MGTWNYRIMRRVTKARRSLGSEISYGIHEVFYDEKDKVTGWTHDPVAVVGDDEIEIQSTLRMMEEALKMPVLDYSTGNAWKEPKDGSKG